MSCKIRPSKQVDRLNLILMYVIIVFTCFFSCNRIVKNDHTTELEKKDIVWNNCYSCHAPSDYLRGLPLDEMLKNAGSVENLSRFLLADFVTKEGCAVEGHCNIRLTKNEVDSVVLFLKNIIEPTY